MTQTLNKAFKMSSLFKDFNQTPLADYGNVLAGFEILAFSSKLSAESILGHSENFKKKKIPGEMSISRDGLHESIWKFVTPAWKVRNSSFLVCVISLDTEKSK